MWQLFFQKTRRQPQALADDRLEQPSIDGVSKAARRALFGVLWVTDDIGPHVMQPCRTERKHRRSEYKETCGFDFG
jgi:hypothetical protein